MRENTGNFSQLSHETKQRRTYYGWAKPIPVAQQQQTKNSEMAQRKNMDDCNQLIQHTQQRNFELVQQAKH